jgi:4-amino-4-deoxy-L-arabinose transferase-like glycosyltransferase
MTEHAPGDSGRSAPRLPAANANRRLPIGAHLRALFGGALFGMLLITLLTQIPAVHRVDLGGADAAYVQGFGEPETVDGVTARRSAAASVLLFPQAGLPGAVTIRLRNPDIEPPAAVRLLLNGTTELDAFTVGPEWLEREVRISGGVLKASDFFVQIVADGVTTPDRRSAGVFVDQATYRTAPPTFPYPSQLLYGALIGAFLVLIGPFSSSQLPVSSSQFPVLGSWFSVLGSRLAFGLALYGLAWLLLYRLALPGYPYPLRMFPPLAVLALGGAVLVRHGPALAARAPVLVRWAAPVGVMGVWMAATLRAAAEHVTLSRPGVENDFRVFATRETLAQVFQADGFYNLGYPLLLWMVRPFTAGNAFLAGRLLAALSGAVLLAAAYLLARRLLPHGAALLALIILALSGFVAQYGLYVGSDMPFAACVALCVALLVRGGVSIGRDAPPGRLCFFAGVCGGLAFLMRHPGLLLLPWGLLALWIAGQRTRTALLGFLLGFLLAAAPQLVINTVQAGQPLYSQQAKNIWLAVYGGTDWGRWDEAPNDIGLAEVVLRDPLRFADNWWRNLVAYAGSGAEDTSEFGRAVQLRMLNWPSNWLAAGGLLAWIWLLVQQVRTERRDAAHAAYAGLLLLIALYVAGISTAFLLQRFVLPLALIYAVAAGWAALRLTRGGRPLLALSLALIVVLWGGFGAGQRYVLANQPPDEVAAVRMVQQAASPDALIAARVSDRLPLAKYSAIAHQVVDWPVGSDLSRPITADDLETARAAGAQYLLWDTVAGAPPLDNPEAALVAASERYVLYQI